MPSLVALLRMCRYGATRGDVIEAARKRTTTTGEAIFSFSDLGVDGKGNDAYGNGPSTFAIVVTYKGSLLLSFRNDYKQGITYSYGYQPPAPPALVATIVTDRGVYKVGDTVHVKGWVRSAAGKAGEGEFKLDGYTGYNQFSKPVLVSRAYGVFNTTFVVPDRSRSLMWPIHRLLPTPPSR